MPHFRMKVEVCSVMTSVGTTMLVSGTRGYSPADAKSGSGGGGISQPYLSFNLKFVSSLDMGFAFNMIILAFEKFIWCLVSLS
jgi:hypothetical protein